jgi:hypothetical protein
MKSDVQLEEQAEQFIQGICSGNLIEWKLGNQI